MSKLTSDGIEILNLLKRLEKKDEDKRIEENCKVKIGSLKRALENRFDTLDECMMVFQVAKSNDKNRDEAKRFLHKFEELLGFDGIEEFVTMSDNEYSYIYELHLESLMRLLEKAHQE